MADKEINITYEALFELLRRERDRQELQKLSDTFYDDVMSYIKEKLDLMVKLQSENETEKTKKQVENTKRMLTELYERRERKILEMAVNKSRIDNKPMDTSVLLANEKEFFQKVVDMLYVNRKGVLTTVLTADLPKQEFVDTNIMPKVNQDKKEGQKNHTTVVFLASMTSFVGPNLEELGPFQANDIAELPISIANILILKGIAVEKKQ
jgi:DNA replication initiation complex subunit (GINS family)